MGCPRLSRMARVLVVALIAAVLPLPEDEDTWGALSVVFATAKGSVRRNSMDAFTNVPTAGKIAMRFEEESGDRLIGVVLLTEEDDVLLATRRGKAIRFAATDVREFQSRTAAGVRGIRVLDSDEVISLSILRSVDATVEQRDAYLRSAPWKENDVSPALPSERMTELAGAEEFILTVTANGFGKLSSAYEYRRTNRGGQGITNILFKNEADRVVASFPTGHGDQLMLVTDQAKLIRTKVELRHILRQVLEYEGHEVRVASGGGEAIDAYVDLRPGGAWEAHFEPDRPQGQRGSDANEIVTKLVTKGRKQTEDLIKELERHLQPAAQKRAAPKKPVRRKAAKKKKK